MDEGDDEETGSFEEDPGSRLFEGSEDDPSGFDGVPEEEMRSHDGSEVMGRANRVSEL